MKFAGRGSEVAESGGSQMAGPEISLQDEEDGRYRKIVLAVRDDFSLRRLPGYTQLVIEAMPTLIATDASDEIKSIHRFAGALNKPVLMAQQSSGPEPVVPKHSSEGIPGHDKPVAPDPWPQRSELFRIVEWSSGLCALEKKSTRKKGVARAPLQQRRASRCRAATLRWGAADFWDADVGLVERVNVFRCCWDELLVAPNRVILMKYVLIDRSTLDHVVYRLHMHGLFIDHVVEARGKP